MAVAPPALAARTAAAAPGVVVGSAVARACAGAAPSLAPVDAPSERGLAGQPLAAVAALEGNLAQHGLRAPRATHKSATREAKGEGACEREAPEPPRPALKNEARKA